eukprot:7377057-Prymnesium_polylepis.1
MAAQVRSCPSSYEPRSEMAVREELLRMALNNDDNPTPLTLPRVQLLSSSDSMTAVSLTNFAIKKLSMAPCAYDSML